MSIESQCSIGLDLATGKDMTVGRILDDKPHEVGSEFLSVVRFLDRAEEPIIARLKVITCERRWDLWYAWQCWVQVEPVADRRKS